MKRFIVSLLVACQLAVTVPSFADDGNVIVLPSVPTLQPGEADPGAALSPMKKGQTAPFTGVLMSPRATATIIAELNTLDDRIEIEVNKAKGNAKAQCDFNLAEQKTNSDADKGVLQAQLDDSKKQNSILNDALKKANTDKPNVPLWTGLGAVGGVVATILVVFGVAQLTK